MEDKNLGKELEKTAEDASELSESELDAIAGGLTSDGVEVEDAEVAELIRKF